MQHLWADLCLSSADSHHFTSPSLSPSFPAPSLPSSATTLPQSPHPSKCCHLVTQIHWQHGGPKFNFFPCDLFPLMFASALWGLNGSGCGVFMDSNPQVMPPSPWPTWLPTHPSLAYLTVFANKAHAAFINMINTNHRNHASKQRLPERAKRYQAGLGYLVHLTSLAAALAIALLTVITDLWLLFCCRDGLAYLVAQYCIRYLDQALWPSIHTFS